MTPKEAYIKISHNTNSKGMPALEVLRNEIENLQKENVGLKWLIEIAVININNDEDEWVIDAKEALNK